MGVRGHGLAKSLRAHLRRRCSQVRPSPGEEGVGPRLGTIDGAGRLALVRLEVLLALRRPRRAYRSEAPEIRGELVDPRPDDTLAD